MADPVYITYTQLPTVGSSTDADIICAVQGGVSVQQTLSQIIDLVRNNNIITYAGNPNSNLAGQTYELCWDTTNSNLYLCTTTGSASTTVWTLIATALSSTLINFLKLPSSLNLASALTDETGSGSAVFATSPSLTTPTLTNPVISGGTINNNIIGGTTPAAGSFTAVVGTTGTFSGVVTSTGVVNASEAAAGKVGEVLSDAIDSTAAVSLTTGVDQNILVLPLTAGDWDVYGSVAFITDSTISDSAAAISLTSNTIPNDIDELSQSTVYMPVSYTANFAPIYSLGGCRINISTPTDIYLVAYATFAGGGATADAYGKIWARRAR